MCSPIRCEVCGRTTWVGCGLHVDAVKAEVPPEQWCDGVHDQPQAASPTAQTSPR